MSDFFLHTVWTTEQVEHAYGRLDRTRRQLAESTKEIEAADPLARRFDVEDFAAYQ